MELDNTNVDKFKKQVEQTEIEIRMLTERIKDMEPEREKISLEYEGKKSAFDKFRRKYVEQSTYGIYFLAVSFIAFVYITYRVLKNTIVGFMFWPALALLVIAIIGKIRGDQKFQKMKVIMADKEATFNEVKQRYDEFMAIYNADAEELERKQYQWEAAENDRIEAKKDAWIAAQKKNNASAEVQ